MSIFERCEFCARKYVFDGFCVGKIDDGSCLDCGVPHELLARSQFLDARGTESFKNRTQQRKVLSDLVEPIHLRSGVDDK